MRKVFNSVLIIAIFVAFVNSHATFSLVILSPHQYEFTVKQTKLLGQRMQFAFVFLSKDSCIDKSQHFNENY